MSGTHSGGDLWELISESLGGDAISDRYTLSGGSINRAYRVRSESGEQLFLKLNQEDSLSMFEAECDGLNELMGAGAIRVPKPIATGSGAGHAWFVSEYIAFGRSGSEELFGLQMAELHRTTNRRFGWYRDNTIGSTVQQNSESDSWVEFYHQHRLKFQLKLASDNGFGSSLQSKGERLIDRLEQFFAGYSPEPSLLHGDLWGGNRAFDEGGLPVIFDPATYYGDREADIAMTELFGGFGSNFYASYHEAWPLDDGYQVRKTLYNLYHILNHANLFGGGYALQAESMMDQLLEHVR